MAENVISTAGELHDPTILYSMVSIVDEIIRSAGFSYQSCLPGIVEKFDRETHVVSVRPLVKFVDYKGGSHELPTIQMTLWRFQIGGFMIDAPVHVGDVGWMVATDRNAELAKGRNSCVQEKGTCKPKNGRMDYGSGNQGPQPPVGYAMHTFMTGFFIPDSWAKIKLPKGFEDALLIRTIDGKGKSNGQISLKPNGEVGIMSEKGLSVKADINAEGDANLDGPLSVTKDVSVGGGAISISKKDLSGDSKAKFREVRFAVGARNGNLVYQKAYVLASDLKDDGKSEIGSDLGVSNVYVGGDGKPAKSYEYTLMSGDDSNIKFLVDGTESSSLVVNEELDGKTVKLNVYYI